MQSVIDFICSDCSDSFETASSLLKHFALHVSLTQTNEKGDKSNLKRKKNYIPDLYPIKTIKIVNNEPDNFIDKCDNEDNVDSGFEDINPIKFCQVTMEDKKNDTNQDLPEYDLTEKVILTDEKCKTRRFNCVYCSKSFGWSTDLKRHILIHTGERPFKCEFCNLNFTRNFLLQKHRLKYHNEKKINVAKTKIPSLKPLEITNKHKPRKQDKCNIKRKLCSTKAVHQSNVKSLVCSI